MQTEDITGTLDLALRARVVDQATLAGRPKLLSDHGSSYVAGDPAKRPSGLATATPSTAHCAISSDPRPDRALALAPEKPHPAENLPAPRRLEAQIAAFVEDYNHRRYHESIDKLTAQISASSVLLPARLNERIKRQTIADRRLQHRLQGCLIHLPTRQNLPILPNRWVNNSDDGHGWRTATNR